MTTEGPYSHEGAASARTTGPDGQPMVVQGTLIPLRAIHETPFPKVNPAGEVVDMTSASNVYDHSTEVPWVPQDVSLGVVMPLPFEWEPPTTYPDGGPIWREGDNPTWDTKYVPLTDATIAHFQGTGWDMKAPEYKPFGKQEGRGAQPDFADQFKEMMKYYVPFSKPHTERPKVPFITKDSGKRVEFESGFVRDTDEGKIRYDLLPLQPLKRLAELYTRGAEKYGDNNWQLAATQPEFDRFKASAFRHFMQWMMGETDEDHASATCFNMWAYETVTGAA